MASPSDPADLHPQTVVAPEVRLVRNRNVSPTLLGHYQACPLRVRLQYIENAPTPKRYEHNLSQGRIAHDLLHFAADVLARRNPPPAAEQLFAMANRRVPAEEFPSEETRIDFVRQIVRWVLAGIRHLDVSAEYLLVEKYQSRPFGPDDPLTMLFRPDIVLLRHDEFGPFIEIIDYKTGKERPDVVVPVIARFIMNTYLTRFDVNAWKVRAFFTYVWLDHDRTTTFELDPVFCTEPWRQITTTIERLFAETDWPPRPGGLCNWCPYHQTTCKAYSPELHGND